MCVKNTSSTEEFSSGGCLHQQIPKHSIELSAETGLVPDVSLAPLPVVSRLPPGSLGSCRHLEGVKAKCHLACCSSTQKVGIPACVGSFRPFKIFFKNQ